MEAKEARDHSRAWTEEAERSELRQREGGMKEKRRIIHSWRREGRASPLAHLSSDAHAAAAAERNRAARCARGVAAAAQRPIDLTNACAVRLGSGSKDSTSNDYLIATAAVFFFRVSSFSFI